MAGWHCFDSSQNIRRLSKLMLFFVLFGARLKFGKAQEENLEDDSKPWIGVRVMSFNTWNFGKNVEDGLRKIVDSILIANPDIVALQELQPGNVRRLLEILGPRWHGIDRHFFRQGAILDGNPDTGVITRHEMNFFSFTTTDSGVGVDIRIVPDVPSSTVHFWSLHLDWKEYGPYVLCDPDLADNYRYHPSRLQEMKVITAKVNQYMSQKDPNTPVIFVGDFNEPSHLDWVEESRWLHCDRTYVWNVSKHLEDEGYIDAFRAVYPDTAAVPGITWSTVRKWLNADKGDFSNLEPQDRIDWILTKGPRLKAIDAITYQGLGTVRHEPQYINNDWPSDHYGVIADLKLFL